MPVNFLNNIVLPDNARLAFGDSWDGTNADLDIYHDGSDSYISDQGTGLLKILGNGVEIKNAGDTGYMAFFGATGASELYHNTSKKFETTSTGVSITGGFVTTSSSDCAGLNMTSNIAMGSNDITDSNSSAGTAGQILSSLGSGNGVDWIDNDGAGVTSVTGTTPIVSSGGTTPAISINNATGTTVGAAAIQASTGISVSDSSGVYTITNTAPATIDGSGAANQVAYWSDSDTLTGDADLTFDGTDLTCGSDVIIEGQLQFNSNDGATCTPVDWLTYLCPDTGTSVNSKIGYLETNFPDNSKVTFGDASGGDLEIYSDGTDGILYAKVDDLVLKAEDDVFVQVKGGEDGIKVIGDGAVELYYDNSKKIETTNTGVDISGGFTTSASSDCAGLSMTADLAMNSNTLTLDSDANIELDCTLSASQSSGTIIKFGGQMSGLTYGRPAYLYNSGASELWAHVSNVNWSNVTKMLAIPLGTTASSDGMLLNGIYYSATHGLTPGAPAYIGDSTLGSLSNTAPSGSGDVVRVVGYAIDENHIYFCPDNTWVEID